MTIPYFGEFLSLLTAVVWAIAVILFKKSGESVHPIALNLFKNLLAMALILPTMWLFGVSLIQPVPLNDYLWMLLSGAIGIGLADTMFFKSLNLLGAGFIAIIDCLYSPFIIVMSFLWLGERLDVWQIVGVVLIISAIFTASREKGHRTVSSRNLVWGLFWGVSGIIFIALGLIMIKPLLERSSLLWATEVRLIGGSGMLGLILLVYPSRRAVISSLFNSRGWKYTLSGSFMGAYLAMLAWLGGMKYAQASVAAALNQTSNIFIFVFAVIFLKDVINWQRSVGMIVAIVGVFLVMFG